MSVKHLKGMELLLEKMKENEMYFSSDDILTLQDKIDSIKENVTMDKNSPNVTEIRKNLVLDIIKEYELFKTETELMKRILN